jgi:formate dehydrogenase iron-sulfur subunit
MNFGDREDMLKLAEQRLAEAKKKFPNAQLVDADSVRVIFLTAEAPNLYSKTLQADASGKVPAHRLDDRREFLAAMTRPLKSIIG